MTRLTATCAIAVFIVAAGALVATPDDAGDASVLAAGQSADSSDAESSDADAPTPADEPGKGGPDDDGDTGGGWEEHRPTVTSPDNHRPEIPPGHDKPTTTAHPRPTTTVRPGSTPSTTSPPTTSTPPLCFPASPSPATRPSDLVPQCSVLDAFPEPGYVGPIDPAHPNQRPWDALVEHGAIRGYARTWLATSGPGGYSVYAYEFPDAGSAQAAAADSFASYIEDFGAAPFTVREGVSGALIVADCARAYWTEGRFLRVVDISTQFARDVVPAQAHADVRTIVNALIGS